MISQIPLSHLQENMGLIATKPVFQVSQTSLLSYRDELENLNFTCSMSRYDTFQEANNKGADRTVRMRRLV